MNVIDILQICEQFARAGGGGSSSGGGGSGGGIFEGAFIIFIMGTVVGLGISAGVNRVMIFMRLPYSRIASAMVIGVFSLFILWLMYITSQTTLASPAIMIIFFAIYLIFVWGGWFIFYDIGRIVGDGSNAAVSKIRKAYKKDPVWLESALRAHVREVFLRFQNDWSRVDLESMKTYLTKSYFEHNKLMLLALEQLGRRSIMENVKIKEIYLEEANDSLDNSQDTFTAVIIASARDRLIDAQTGKNIFVDRSIFVEFWKFERSGDIWLLSGIRQYSESPQRKRKTIVEFARKHNLFYSLDTGWLFLPRRGALFSKKAPFGVSDVNNHTIGVYKNILIQLYTLSFNNDRTAKLSDRYIVAQIQLPKSYGNIMVRPKNTDEWKKWIRFKNIPKGFQQYQFEWREFNERYEVYATDVDRLATFELMNPGFMAYVYDTDPAAAIEVADNIVYMYSESKQLKYDKLFAILERAHKELKL